MKLISMTEFVLEQVGWFDSDVRINKSEFQQRVLKYALFLNQPLTLGMFVPCDEEGEPLPFTIGKNGTKIYSVGSKHIEAAKERVLFEGFELEKTEYKNCYTIFVSSPDLGFDKLYFDTYHFNENGFVRRKNKTVEELITSINPDIGKLTLTPSAQKQIGL